MLPTTASFSTTAIHSAALTLLNRGRSISKWAIASAIDLNQGDKVLNFIPYSLKSVYHRCGEARSEAVVYIDDKHIGGATVEHSEERSHPAERGSVSYARRN